MLLKILTPHIPTELDEEAVDPSPTFEISICLKSLDQLDQSHIDRLRLLLITAVLKRNNSDAPPPEVISNFCDIKGSKLSIKSKNLATINFVKEVISSTETYITVDRMDLPGIRVKLLLPQWCESLIAANKVIDVILIHHPSLDRESITQYQPPKTLDNKSFVYYMTLNYDAQKYFAEREWKLHLIGITIKICDADTRKEAPSLQEDLNLNKLSSMELGDGN